jgi:twitching motility two-component system response regulator PilH
MGNNATVLVVDDSKTALVTLNKMLRGLGFQCLTALNARDGIEMAKSLKPDLILMDVVMPEINGFQATRLLRKIPDTAHIPIIIISGNKMQTEEFWGEKMGANGFLPKPLDQQAFLKLAGELLHAEHMAAS